VLHSRVQGWNRFKMDIIEESAAEKELENILNFFFIDEDSIVETRSLLLSIIKSGRIALDEEGHKIKLILASPIKLENGEIIKSFDFSEPTAGDLKCLDRYKKDDSISKTIHLVSRMTSIPIGVVEKISSRDLKSVGMVASLFL